MRSPSGPQRRQPKRQGPAASSSSSITSHPNATFMSSGVSSSSDDVRVQNIVDEFFQPGKVSSDSFVHILNHVLFCFDLVYTEYSLCAIIFQPTLGQIVRQKLSEGRKVAIIYCGALKTKMFGFVFLIDSYDEVDSSIVFIINGTKR